MAASLAGNSRCIIHAKQANTGQIWKKIGGRKARKKGAKERGLVVGFLFRRAGGRPEPNAGQQLLGPKGHSAFLLQAALHGQARLDPRAQGGPLVGEVPGSGVEIILGMTNPSFSVGFVSLEGLDGRTGRRCPPGIYTCMIRAKLTRVTGGGGREGPAV